MATEFDPKSEKHFPLLIIKGIDPDCTFELQIEHGDTGQIERFTTTDDFADDMVKFKHAVLLAFEAVWSRFERREDYEPPM